jgi:hypothetical protein
LKLIATDITVRSESKKSTNAGEERNARVSPQIHVAGSRHALSDAVVAEEEILVINPALEFQTRSQGELTLEHFDCARAQLHDAPSPVWFGPCRAS